ncbi:hypothetical protein NQD34_015827 [Periophthalmus magnuspinnatus]|nr:hypothetical protein NQD34_015827 [Periophthalmus magnuspinnatus]
MRGDLGGSRRRGPRRPDMDTSSGDMECHLAGGKEPELVREVERYRLDIVGLASTQSLGSGTQLPERGWTLHFSGVALGERRRAGVGLLIAPQLSRFMLGFGSWTGLSLLCWPIGQTAVQSTRPSWSPWEGH